MAEPPTTREQQKRPPPSHPTADGPFKPLSVFSSWHLRVQNLKVTGTSRPSGHTPPAAQGLTWSTKNQHEVSFLNVKEVFNHLGPSNEDHKNHIFFSFS